MIIVFFFKSFLKLYLVTYLDFYCGWNIRFFKRIEELILVVCSLFWEVVKIFSYKKFY